MITDIQMFDCPQHFLRSQTNIWLKTAKMLFTRKRLVETTSSVIYFPQQWLNCSESAMYCEPESKFTHLNKSIISLYGKGRRWNIQRKLNLSLFIKTLKP